MTDEIPILVQLSLADRECHRLHERTEAIPRELGRHEAELVVQRRALEERTRSLGDMQRERRALERDADVAKTRRRELELQQFRVKNNVEYQALVREIEEMRRRASEFEDQALALLTDEDAIQAEIQRLQELVDQEERKFAAVQGRLETELAGYRAELDRSRSKREGLVAQLAPQVRSRYERIRRSKGDMAVVGIEQGACGGCGYQLPPQKIAEVQKREHMLSCEGCGRILVAMDLE